MANGDCQVYPSGTWNALPIPASPKRVHAVLSCKL